MTLDQARAGFGARIRRDLIDNAVAADQRQARDAKVPVSSGARGFSRVRDTYAVPLYTLMAGVGLLLIIICGNVANLLLARAIARQREMSVRLAIGAERWRLIRQLLTENLLLALCGAGAGLAVAWYGSHLLLTLAADGGSPMPLAVRLDLPVLGFTAGLSVLAALLFGLVPALRASRVDLASTMRAHARSVSGEAGGRVPIGRLLIACQVALSLVLLVGAGLLVRSLVNVEGTDAGLDRDHLLIVDVDAQGRGYTGQREHTLARSLREKFARIPGVTEVTFSENGIFSGTESSVTLQVPGFTARRDEDTVANVDQVGPNYVRGVGGRLIAGRDIAESDGPHGARVVLVNETMAKFYFGGANAVGRTVRLDDTTSAEIVGVLADIRDHSLDGEQVRRFYLPYLQQREPSALRFIVRSAGDPDGVANLVRREILATDALLVIDGLVPLADLMRQSVREARLVARLAAGFGVLALLLAAVGLYGVMTYAITQRTGEIGLRVALGASRRNVIRLILMDALRVVGLGLAAGIPLALGITRLLQSQLHGVSAADPAAIGIALAVLAASAAAAALLPALRASRVAPMVALRQD